MSYRLAFTEKALEGIEFLKKSGNKPVLKKIRKLLSASKSVTVCRCERFIPLSGRYPAPYFFLKVTDSWNFTIIQTKDR